MARTGFMTAGFALSAVLVLASCDAAPPRAAKTIAPPKPDITTETAVAPAPKSEPQIVASQPRPRPEPAGKPSSRKPPSIQMARHTRYGHGVARNSPPYRYGDNRPMSGPVYEADRGPGQPPGAGCDETCRYRAWFRDYNAWYQAYGRRYAEYPPAPSAINRDWPRTAYRPDEARVMSERDRLDPWHGYDGHDGPQNGY